MISIGDTVLHLISTAPAAVAADLHARFPSAPLLRDSSRPSRRFPKPEALPPRSQGRTGLKGRL